ncbi:hypothetical protein KC349_g5166 [Hortaea werneckii]|nr:hypothetical protein KC349_g5166 [Hortaea werneckii]
MLVDDHLLYHPSWDRPDPRSAELYQPAPVCLRPTINKRHHWVFVLCSVSYGGASKNIKQEKTPRSADRIERNDQDKKDNADTQSDKATNIEDRDDNISKSDLDVTFRYLNEDYDWDNKIRVAKGVSGGDGKTFAYYISFDDLRDSGEASHLLVSVMLSTPTRSRQTPTAYPFAASETENKSFASRLDLAMQYDQEHVSLQRLIGDWRGRAADRSRTVLQDLFVLE